MSDKLTHIDANGRARMVDVSGKASTKRIASARGRVLMSTVALELARTQGGKGDVRAAAEIVGVMAAKRTSDLIPMCHPLSLSSVAPYTSSKAPAWLESSKAHSAEMDEKERALMDIGRPLFLSETLVTVGAPAWSVFFARERPAGMTCTKPLRRSLHSQTTSIAARGLIPAVPTRKESDLGTLDQW